MSTAENSNYNYTPQQLPVSNDEVEIDLVEVFYLLWANILKIILCLILGAGVAFAYSFFLITPKYQATAKMYIINASKNSVVDISDLNISSALRADYQQLIKSRHILETVIDELDLGYTYKQLGEMISIANPSDTRIITVTATSAIPQESADIANEMVKQAKVYLPEIMKSEEPSIYEDALVPTVKSSPSYSRNTMIGGLLGALLYCAYVLVKYFMNDTLMTSDDVFKYIGIQPLAVIPEGNLGEFNKIKKKKTGGNK